jgi:hypothetical protein
LQTTTPTPMKKLFFDLGISTAERNGSMIISAEFPSQDLDMSPIEKSVSNSTSQLHLENSGMSGSYIRRNYLYGNGHKYGIYYPDPR